MMSGNSNPDQIKGVVRDHYGARARRVIELSVLAPDDASACCGPADMERALNIYSEGQMSGLPTEALAASAGCGNPTALAGLQPGERVLDLGSGGGIDCFIAAQAVGDSGYVIGLDMTPDMLALAQSNKAKLGLENVEFVKGEIEDIPLPDSHVNVVISNCVICLSPDKDAVFGEAFRVLTPGGRLHVSDMLALTQEGPTKTDSDAWSACVAGAEYEEVYLGRLENAGFIDIETTESNTHYTEEGRPLNVASVKVVAIKPN